ncbi:hypothetical protein pb186bvf_012640 [Paramecium bursaria]
MSRVQTGDSFSMKFSDQQKIADLERQAIQQLEQKQKQKSIKKLQIRCINYDYQLRENGNRLKDSQVTIHQHKFKTNKENKENNSTRTFMCAQLNLKALEDAEQFLNEGRIYSSRMVKFKKVLFLKRFPKLRENKKLLSLCQLMSLNQNYLILQNTNKISQAKLVKIQNNQNNTNNNHNLINMFRSLLITQML